MAAELRRTLALPFLLLLLAGCAARPAAAVIVPTATVPAAAAITATPAPSTATIPPATPTPLLATRTPPPTPTLPAEHYIRISGHKQYFTLGCEAATAKDWANFFGHDFNEMMFAQKCRRYPHPPYPVRLPAL